MQPGKHALVQALRLGSTWRRALQVGLPVGVIQVAINQGHHWSAGLPAAQVVLRSLLSVFVSFLVALLSATLASKDVSKAQ